MNPKFLLPALLFSLFAACERPAPVADNAEEHRRAEQMRELDDRIARLQEMEDRAADRKVVETQEERDRLLREKKELEAERDRLMASRKDAETQKARAEREAREAKERATEVADRAEADRANAQVDFFYPALDPHGEWLEVDGLGYCWQPRVAEKRGWRPYTDGRWVFTDYGWTWDSNEPFGWAVYHYGRWTRLPRVGWLWVPGTEWGPAWVAWRRSDDYIGWAPLPPDAWSASGFNAAVDSYYDIGPGAYTFVSVESLGAPTYVDRVVAPEQNVTIINKTVNITNVTYKKVENTTVVYNAGPDIERVNRRGGEIVPRMKVERVADARPQGRNEARQQGGVLRMVAPRLQSGKKTGAKPQRVKERVKSGVPDRGWAEISDKAAIEQVRARVKAEAKQAEAQERAGGKRENRPAATPLPVAPAATPPIVKATPAVPKAREQATPEKPKQPAEPPTRKPFQPAPAGESQSPGDRTPRRDRAPGGERGRTGEEKPSAEVTQPAENPAGTPAGKREGRSSAPATPSETPAAPAATKPAIPSAPEASETKAPETSSNDPATAQERRRPRAPRDKQEPAATPSRQGRNAPLNAPATPEAPAQPAATSDPQPSPEIKSPVPSVPAADAPNTSEKASPTDAATGQGRRRPRALRDSQEPAATPSRQGRNAPLNATAAPEAPAQPTATSDPQPSPETKKPTPSVPAAAPNTSEEAPSADATGQGRRRPRALREQQDNPAVATPRQQRRRENVPPAQ